MTEQAPCPCQSQHERFLPNSPMNEINGPSAVGRSGHCAAQLTLTRYQGAERWITSNWQSCSRWMGRPV
jgi:hypothetical protein